MKAYCHDCQNWYNYDDYNNAACPECGPKLQKFLQEKHTKELSVWQLFKKKILPFYIALAIIGPFGIWHLSGYGDFPKDLRVAATIAATGLVYWPFLCAWCFAIHYNYFREKHGIEVDWAGSA